MKATPVPTQAPPAATQATPAVTEATPALRNASLESIGFEQALDELDVLVRRMESGQLSLDESIAAYRRGAELARFCQAKLTQAEQEIKRLEGGLLKPLDISELKMNTMDSEKAD